MHASPAPLVIGVDVGGTNMQLGVVDDANTIVGRAARRTQADRGLDCVLDNIVEGVDDACRAAGRRREEIAAVGVAAAGAIDIPRGVVLVAPNLGWRDVPLGALLGGRLGLPVVVDNDVNGAVWGEYHAGAGPGTGDTLGVWVGTGVGGGLVLDGRLHHGDHFTAGEFGHTVVTPDGPPEERTIEDNCSRTGMRAILGRRLPDHPDSVLHELTGGDASRINTAVLRQAYEAGDPLTVAVVDRGADLLGVGIANVVTLLAIGHVIVGGGITEALGAPYIERIRRSFDADVFPDRCRQTPLVMTQLAADSGLLGAALLARASV